MKIHIRHYRPLSVYPNYSGIINLLSGIHFGQRGEAVRGRILRGGGVRERRPNAVKGLLNATLSFSSRIPGCVGVQARAGEGMMMVMVNAQEGAFR